MICQLFYCTLNKPEIKKMNTLVFKTKKEALDFLKSVQRLDSSLDKTFFYPKGTYYLAHGEYAKPAAALANSSVENTPPHSCL